jgi:ribulose-bisphosphate carboxylase large chain
MFNIFRDPGSLSPGTHVIATYDLESSIDLEKAAYDLSIGQSVGNPNIRNGWETDEMFERHACLVLTPDLKGKKRGLVDIAFPVVNTDWSEDGIAHFLCQTLGGQADIDHILRSRLMKLNIPHAVRKHFNKPTFGLSGMRALTGQYDKPLFGGIVKPKTGLSPSQLLEMVQQLVDGGVDFIKEDEILSNPSFCRLTDRVPLITKYLRTCGRKVVYCFAINGDPHVIEKRASYVAAEGGNGIHINFWSGLGAYRSIRRLNLPLYLHFQKSGDKVITHPDNHFGMSWLVMCEIAALSGVDSIHAGMFGGYLSDNPQELQDVMTLLTLHNVVPALSCGMHPGLVNYVTENVGVDYLANVGGALHGHPGGTQAGCRAMRQAVDRTYGEEYEAAITTWGYNNGKHSNLDSHV